MEKRIYQDYELEALIGFENLNRFDFSAVRDSLTDVDEHGDRFWKDLDADAVNAVIADHDCYPYGLALAEKAWRGEGWYMVAWSDGGVNWEPVWHETLDGLADTDATAAYVFAEGKHQPYIEYLGCGDSPATVY